MFRLPIYVGLTLLLMVSGTIPLHAAEPPVDFKRDIRPILSNRCFACHGPDEEKVESGLRLDRFDGVTHPADSGRIPIVPKNPDTSELIRRVSSTDDDERMPPPHFGGRLTDSEIAKLQQWIQEGAPYSKHWSFDRLSPPDREQLIVPALPGFESWQTHAIDQLVLRQLLKKGWTPSQQADKQTLLRRVSLDLTGLPPSIEMQQAFLKDNGWDAYERAVDELLASPAYGEHWARKWLDLARYADSAGYADDPQRTIWGYRDWVIRALNENMPFDQFTIEQLAADLLPNATDDQLIATAFHRNTLTNNEGGTNDEEFRNVAVVDRVNTTMSVWMGVTMACAQCHTHKFDPITQKEYFQVFAIFNQTQDADRRDESPTLDWFTPEQRQMRKEWLEQQQSIETQLAAPDPNALPDQRKWENQLSAQIDWKTIIPSSASASGKAPMTIDSSGNIRVQNDAVRDTYTIEWDVKDLEQLQGLRGLAIESLPHPDLPGGGAGMANGNFVLSDVRARVMDPQTKGVNAKYVRVELPGKDRILSLAEVQVFSGADNLAPNGKATQINEDYGGSPNRAIDRNTTGDFSKNSVTHTKSCDDPWWELELQNTATIEKVILWNRTDGNVEMRLDGARVLLLNDARETVHSYQLEKAKASQAIELAPSLEIVWSVASADYFQPGFEPKLAIDSDRKSGWAVGESVDRPHTLQVAVSPGIREKLKSWQRPARVKFELDFQSQFNRHVLAGFRLAISTDDKTEPFLKLPQEVQKLVAKGPDQRNPDDEEKLHRYFVSEVFVNRQPLRDQRVKIAKQLADLKPATSVPILRELADEKQRKTFIQLRGNYRVHGDSVDAGLPVAFHAYQSRDSSNRKLNRLDFARWLVQEDNPLTSRVIANRYWENLFGVGIVRTSEEFGSQGDLPTHPELLDYLAQRLLDLRWDTKQFLREIVLSNTYRQSSSVTPARYEEDPDNVYLSRGPRFRATAEQIRDSSLAASGLLSLKMYGPPTRPPQPTSGLRAAFGSNTDWDTSSGSDRYRRGLYTQWRRSSPYPSMATFDAPNREVCVLKRDRTNTPLQALVTLNDPAYIEAAQGLARRVVLYELPNQSPDEIVSRVFEYVLSRKPQSTESIAILKLFDAAKAELGQDEKRALLLATNPLGPLPEGASSIDLAAWTAVCNVVLNLDEFLMKP